MPSTLVSPQFVSPADAFARDIITATGQRRTKLEYLPYQGETSSGPQAFLVTVPPQGVVPPHFHTVDQFQVFFGVPGAAYKGHPLADCVVHYAEAYTTYGPYSAADEQVEFFTLRPDFTDYVGYMPKQRAEKLKRSGRNIHVDVDRSALEDVPAQTALRSEPLIAATADGLLAELVHLGPGATWTMPAPTLESAGRYTVIGFGNLVHRNRNYGPRSVIWSGPTSTGCDVVADAATGCVLLSLQFPSPSSPS